jgi:hypothetical protein
LGDWLPLQEAPASKKISKAASVATPVKPLVAICILTSSIPPQLRIGAAVSRLIDRLPVSAWR